MTRIPLFVSFFTLWILAGQATTADTNMAQGKPVQVVGGNVNGTLSVVTDGAFAPEQTQWQTSSVWWIGTTPGLEIDLGSLYLISGLQIQADANDIYSVQCLNPANGVWTTVWNVPTAIGSGLVTRPSPSTVFSVSPAVVTSGLRVFATSGDNMYAIGQIQAYGSPAMQELTVNSLYGGAWPGTLTTNWGTALSEYVTNSPVVNGATQYVCTAGSVASNAYTQVSATNVTLTLTNDATLTWAWQTNYQLNATAGLNGLVTVSNGWYAAGTTGVVLSATASNQYYFVNWTGTLSTNANPLTLTIDQAQTLTANFLLNTQTITFAQIGAQLTTNTLILSAAASSGLPVTFSVGSGPAVISNGTNLSFVGGGTVNIVASQAGDVNWAAATNVTRSFNVTLVNQARVTSTNMLGPEFSRTNNPNGVWTYAWWNSGHTTFAIAPYHNNSPSFWDGGVYYGGGYFPTVFINDTSTRVHDGFLHQAAGARVESERQKSS